jgi:3-hydroxyacyl-CoA dehydrogenase
MSFFLSFLGRKFKSFILFLGSLLEKNVTKGKMTAEERKETLARITTSTDAHAFAKADIVIEVNQNKRK